MTLNRILAAQSPNGAFRSTVTHHGKAVPDENGFVTALILCELLHPGRQTYVPPSAAEALACERALDFLERCRGPVGFHFYPPGEEPEWMGVHLSGDADDTALMARILFEAERLTLSEVTRLADTALEPYRQHYNPDPILAWIHPGCYRTWLNHKQRPNPVDCCVNANVAALLAAIGQKDSPGFCAARDTVIAGIRWAAGVDWRFELLTPYYPHPAELFRAVDRGVQVGIEEFREIVRPAHWTGDLPYAGSLDRKTWWNSSALQAIRNRNRSQGEHREFDPDVRTERAARASAGLRS
jgi:hypothetical protein